MHNKGFPHRTQEESQIKEKSGRKLGKGKRHATTEEKLKRLRIIKEIKPQG